MDTTVFERAFSLPRLNRFLKACDEDWEKATWLYRSNIRLSSSLFSTISIFEVILRNGINHHYQKKFGNEWLLSQSLPSGFLSHRGCERSRKSVLQSIEKLGEDYSHDAVVAKLSFSFWRYLFASKEYSAGGDTLMKIFLKKPFGRDYNQTYVFNLLDDIINLRNRIAHHEPVCFVPKLNHVSCWPSIQVYVAIKEMLEWLDFEPTYIFMEVDFVLEELKNLHARNGNY